MIMYRLMDRKTGKPIHYASDAIQPVLENPDRSVAESLANECRDYGIDAEIVEVESP